jgi:hypothetical protein
MRDQTGKVWKVIKERDFHLQVQDRDGTKAHLKPRDPSSPVTLMGASEGEAEAALRDILKAKAIARRAAGETGWLVPPFPTPGQPGAVQEGRAHMIMAHGVWCEDVKTTAGLIEAHISSHQRPDKGYQEHTHPGGNPS